MPYERDQIFNMIKELGCSKVELHYNGGNDEGHIEHIVFTMKDGTSKTVNEDYNDEFHQGLAQPIYNRYGSFAGDFSVNGILTWDIENGTLTDSGEEEEKVWKPYTHEEEL